MPNVQTRKSNWGGWIRTTDLLINSQALCQLSYTPKARLHAGVMEFHLSAARKQRLGSTNAAPPVNAA